MNEHYQMLIIGHRQIHKIPRIKNMWKFKLLFHTYKIVKIYNSEQSDQAIKYLNSINQINKIKFTGEIEEYLFSRKVASWSQLLINLVSGNALCLERSLAVCASLRSLGILAQVVIGRKIAMNASNGFEFHAWVEVNNMPINDTVATKSQFIEIHRYPASEEVPE